MDNNIRFTDRRRSPSRSVSQTQPRRTKSAHPLGSAFAGDRRRMTKATDEGDFALMRRLDNCCLWHISLQPHRSAGAGQRCVAEDVCIARLDDGHRFVMTEPDRPSYIAPSVAPSTSAARIHNPGASASHSRRPSNHHADNPSERPQARDSTGHVDRRRGIDAVRDHGAIA